MKKLFLLLILSTLFLSSCGSDEPVEETINEESNVENEIEEEKEVEELQVELTEDEYKALCEEMYFDEVFFGGEDLEGKYVKLDLMLAEKCFFTSSDMYTDTWKEHEEKYDLCTDFYRCCVKHEEQESYFGRQIAMWFSELNGISPNDLELGQKVIVYAEVIYWSDNTLDGYNTVVLIPKYIEPK